MTVSRVTFSRLVKDARLIDLLVLINHSCVIESHTRRSVGYLVIVLLYRLMDSVTVAHIALISRDSLFILLRK